MIDRDVDELAKNLLKAIANREATREIMETRGTALINEFLAKTNVKSALLGLNVEKKIRLWGERGSGLQILYHGTDTPKKNTPHDHGRSWALYHQVVGVTKMSTYGRSSGSEGMPGEAHLQLIEQVDLSEGNALFFGPFAIHSADHPSPPARWIRVTGNDLDFVKRLRFSIERKEAVIEKKN